MAEWTNVQTSMAPGAGGQPVPSRPEEITASWLTACLQHDGVLPESARVTALEIVAIGQGRGFAGRIARLTPRYEPEGAGPPTLVGKFATEHAPTREMMTAMDAYVREVRFYRELAPEVGVSTPRCHFAHFDAERGSCCMVLEDLAPAAAVDRHAGFSVEQAEQLLEALAQMHARFWDRQDELPWAKLSDELVDAVRVRFIASAPRFVEQWGAQFPEIAAAARTLLPFLDDEEALAQVKMRPQTLTHNDIHTDNVFMPTAEGGRLSIIDWQTSSFSRHGAADVTRTIAVGLRPELRRRHDRRLLRHYHRALVAAGVRGYSYRALVRRYREEMVALVLVCVLAFDTLDLSDVGPEASELLGQRIELSLADSGLTRLLRVMGVWFRVRKVLRRMLGLSSPVKRLPR